MRPLPSLVLVASLLGACGQDGPRGDPLTGAGAPPAASPHAAPAPSAGLPPGHPPMDGPVTPAPPLGGPVAATASPFTWTAPSAWKESKTESSMRLAQYDLPEKAADGMIQRLAVFPPMGGKQPNIDRWVGQMKQADGTSSKDKAKITEEKRDGFTLTRIELRGIFAGQMVPGQGDAVSVPGWTFLGAIVEMDADPSKGLIVKLAGPSAQIDPELANFDALLASIRKR